MPAILNFGPAERELVITRLIDVRRAKLFRCWVEPALITQWFTPPPFKTIAAEVDLRPGGSSVITMHAPDGTEMPNCGIYLDVVVNELLVFTDAYTSARVPSAKPFFTGILTFEDEAGQTRYTARARHWNPISRDPALPCSWPSTVSVVHRLTPPTERRRQQS